MEPFRFRDCACPGTPHADGDTVTMRDRLPFAAGVRALALIFDGSANPQASSAMPVYLFDGPERWNLVDDDGDPVPLTRDALEALPFEDQYEIADHADSLYSAAVIAPLLRRMKPSSGTGPTGATPRRRSRS